MSSPTTPAVIAPWAQRAEAQHQRNLVALEDLRRTRAKCVRLDHWWNLFRSSVRQAIRDSDVARERLEAADALLTAELKCR